MTSVNLFNYVFIRSDDHEVMTKHAVSMLNTCPILYCYTSLVIHIAYKSKTSLGIVEVGITCITYCWL